MDTHVRVSGGLSDEAVERLGQAGAPERRTVQVPDEGPDAIRGPVLRLLDLLERELGLVELPCRQVPSGDVDLDREPEQVLRQVVMQERRDLQSFVLSLLGHAVREGPQQLLTVLELSVRLLERLAAEEHLSSKQQGDNEHGDSPEPDSSNGDYFGEKEAKEGQSDITDKKLAESSHPQLTNDPLRRHSSIKANYDGDDATVDEVVDDGRQQSRSQ